MFSFFRIAAVGAALTLFTAGCAASRLVGYVVAPGTPAFEPGDVKLAGLHAPVEVRQSGDGLWHVMAADEHDLMFATGYLQARDRLAQLDLFRRLARGRVSELIGDVPFGDKTSVEVDLYNRALDFVAQGHRLASAASPEERAAGLAFVDGINAYIAGGARPLEHRLLGAAAIEPWSQDDSLAIYGMLMYSLSSNANREIRRLLIACAADTATAERVWPGDIDFDAPALPEEAVSASPFARAPAVVPELAAELPKLCLPAPSDLAQRPRGETPAALAAAAAFTTGFSASNSWAVAGARTASGKPVLANDPHLPLMNPPIVWGVEQEIPGVMHAAGFTLPGLHRVVFGHNDHVAWSATTNHMDRQDLVVLRPALYDAQGNPGGTEIDGTAVPFAVTTFTIAVKGAEPRRFNVRYTADGPLVNDIEPSLPGGIPLTALRLTEMPEARDLDAARGFSYATSATDFVIAVRHMDGGCTNWVYADTYGTIGYESPCVLPIRNGYSGAFPVPGWLSKYRWQGYVNKELLPAARNPRQGFIATANSRMVPPDRFFTALDNDSSEPNRYLRAASLIESVPMGGYTAAHAARAQTDVTDAGWSRVRREIAEVLCRDAVDADLEAARRALCKWNGAMTPDSVGATIYQLLSHALLDRALADEVPGGASGALWRFVENVPMFEANLSYLWLRPAGDPVWDDVRTKGTVENKLDILRLAFLDAVLEARERFGDEVADWKWGDVAPFRVRHLFAGGDGVLGAIVNSDTYAGLGSPTTLYKNQWNRADREKLRAGLGPVVRTIVDLGAPWEAQYALSGGESGWPRDAHYGDAVDDWRAGRLRKLSAGDGTTVKLVP